MARKPYGTIEIVCDWQLATVEKTTTHHTSQYKYKYGNYICGKFNPTTY